MILPPSFLRMGFGGQRRNVGIWLPIFLLWPLFVLVFLVVLVVSVIADILAFIAGARYHSYTELLFACCGLLNAVRGLSVFVDSPDTTIDFRLI